MTVSSPKGELNAAIVPPYNYTPTQKSPAVFSSGSVAGGAGKARVSPVRIGKVARQQFTECTYESDEGIICSVQGLAPAIPKSSTKPLTKTEMLIARRRQSHLNSRNKSAEDKKAPCLVTTV